MRQDRYTTKMIHPVCVNLEPHHFEFLTQIANTRFRGNYNNTIFYLLNKYLNFLYTIRITPTKRTETATYQPKTKRYRRWTILVNPVLWSKLFEMRHFIGYSMSALLRIMLDWEMQGMGYDIIPLIPMPVLTANNTNQSDQPERNRLINNYTYRKQGNYGARFIFCSFLDEYS